MKYSIASAIYSLAVLGSTVQASPTAYSFSLIAARSGSPIHLSSIEAADNRFWVHRNVSTFCPLKNKKDCPPGDETVFTKPSSGKPAPLYLDVEVPGGQGVYVAKDGALGFTVAHSSFLPEGATTGGFYVRHVKGQSYGVLRYGAGFAACPTKKGKQAESGPYKIFALREGMRLPHENCLGFQALVTKHDDRPAAWQYE